MRQSIEYQQDSLINKKYFSGQFRASQGSITEIYYLRLFLNISSNSLYHKLSLSMFLVSLFDAIFNDEHMSLVQAKDSCLMHSLANDRAALYSIWS